MIYILLVSATFLILTTLVLLRNQFEFQGIAHVQLNELPDYPMVSICIPARNEERSINQCVLSAVNQNYPNFEVIVLNDQSTDSTGDILKQLSAFNPNLQVINGTTKPDEWLGKPWACHQLSKAAQGEILLFIDADVWLDHHTLLKTVPYFSLFDAVTVWPEQKLDSFWEQMIVPMIYFALFTLLPAIYVERPPRWMPKFTAEQFKTKFVAACGQFFAFTREAYEAINGHEAVHNEVVEDMALARNLKESDRKLKMFHGANEVFCRMYHNHNEIWNGFQKNFYSGFNNLFEFFFMWVIHIVVYLAPVVLFFKGLLNSDFEIILLSSALIILTIAQRIVLSAKFSWNHFYAVLHPLSVIWFQILAVKIMLNKLTGKKSMWKGREV